MWKGSAASRGAGALALLGILSLALWGCPESMEEAGEGSQSGADDQRTPDFTLQDLDGRPVSLGDLRGKTVLLDFWATWCAPCVHQIPVLNDFQAAHGGDDVAVYGIAVDAEGEEVVAPFAEKHDVAYPILLGSEALARSFGAIGFPTLYVIAPDGRIDSIHIGVAHLEDLEAALEQARDS